jgi:hypothetical protein
MFNSRNRGMWSLQGSNLQKFVSKANSQPDFKAQPTMSNNFLLVHARQKNIHRAPVENRCCGIDR